VGWWCCGGCAMLGVCVLVDPVRFVLLCSALGNEGLERMTLGVLREPCSVAVSTRVKPLLIPLSPGHTPHRGAARRRRRVTVEGWS
jgi:hypothetical protein